MDARVSAKLSVPAAELHWRFSRSSGPGGQHVNTSDSRVELTWDISSSRVLTDVQRETLLQRCASRLVNGAITVSASEERSQLRNREIAVAKLVELIQQALAPQGPKRRATKPTRGSARRHTAAKTQRSQTKKLRQRPPRD